MSGLFNNQYIDNAKQNMTPKQLEEYSEKGIAMYDTVDFTTSTINKHAQKDPNSVVIIIKSLQSGLDLEDLDNDEIEILKKHYGKDYVSIVEKLV